MRPLLKVVLPDPVAPLMRMFLRERTANSKKAGQAPASRSRSSSSSVSSSSSLAAFAASKRPARVKSSMPKVTLDGLRMVIETVSAGTAGGSTI